jgi:hypothetical protein
MEDFATFAKGFMLIFVVDSQWLKCLVMCQNLWNVFPNHKQMVQHAIHTFVVETMDDYVMPTLNYFVTITFISFDWWMFKSKYDTFSFIISFINSHWVPCHVTMGLFEATYTTRVAMTTLWRIYFHLTFYVTNWLHMWWTRVAIYESDKLLTINFGHLEATKI